MNEWDVMIFVTLGGIGATFLFIGTLFAIVTTAGLNKKLGIASILFPPIAIVYCFFHIEQSKFPLKIFAIGIVTALCVALIAYAKFHST